MSRPAAITAVTGVVLVLAAAVFLGPGLLRERRPVAATGTPAPLSTTSPIRVAPGSIACSDDVTITRRSGVAQIAVTQ